MQASPPSLTWSTDHAWSRRFTREITAILGTELIVEAPRDEDVLRNTDLLVLRLDAVRIACRVRRHAVLLQHRAFRDQFTMRAGRPNGVKTELSKVIEGWGDYIFYGFANADETGLIAWLLGDLDVFRLWFNRRIVADQGRLPGTQLENTDGSSSFVVFNIADLPREFVRQRVCWDGDAA